MQHIDIKRSVVCEVESASVVVALVDGYGARGYYFNCDKPKRAIVLLHGIQSHSGWLVGCGDYLRKQGLAVLAMDRRGCGRNLEERGHSNSAEELLSDLDCAVEWLRERTGLERVDMVAVSISGKFALPYAQRYPEKARSLVLVAPGLCTKIDVSLTEKIALGPRGPKEPLKRYPIPWVSTDFLTRNEKMIAFIEQDPLKLTEVTGGFLAAIRRLEVQAARAIGDIACPVAVFLAGADRIADNEATAELLQPIIKKDGNLLQIFPGASHTLDFESEPIEYYKKLVDFLCVE